MKEDEEEVIYRTFPDEQAWKKWVDKFKSIHGELPNALEAYEWMKREASSLLSEKDAELSSYRSLLDDGVKAISKKDKKIEELKIKLTKFVMDESLFATLNEEITSLKSQLSQPDSKGGYEIPNENEIDSEAELHKDIYSRTYYPYSDGDIESSFSKGAKWMRDKLLSSKEESKADVFSDETLLKMFMGIQMGETKEGNPFYMPESEAKECVTIYHKYKCLTPSTPKVEAKPIIKYCRGESHGGICLYGKKGNTCSKDCEVEFISEAKPSQPGAHICKF